MKSALMIATLSPLAASLLIVLLRSYVKTLAVIGTAVSLAGSLFLIASSNIAVTWPGLPGFPLQLQTSDQAVVWSVVVAIVGALITMYATGYFASERRPSRFFATFLGFLAAMQLFIFSGDLILLVVAWELMTLTSFLLIAHEYHRPESGRAAIRAFLTVRTADIALYAAVFTVIIQTGSSAIGSLASLNMTTSILVSLLITIAAGVKAAQTPFGGWLRDAMAGPAPVSALLHSSAMVAAGALLLIKVFPYLADTVLTVIGLIGGITAVTAGVVAVFQPDFKRLLAASTSSQLGLMFLAIGVGAPAAASMHFVAHAFMKSSLFLGAGVFQHSNDTTDFSRLGGVGKAQKTAFAAVTVAGLALAGLPPLAGFFSKDAIIAATEHSVGLFILAVIGTVLTGMYVAVALRQLLQGRAKKNEIAGFSRMIVPLVALVVGVVAFGLFLPHLKDLLGAVPSTILSAGSGSLAATFGLAIGWRFNLSGRTAHLVERASNYMLIENLFLKAAHGGIKAVRYCESKLFYRVYSTGAATLTVSRGIDRLERPSIKGLFSLGYWLQGSSLQTLRKVQTGLVHQELGMSMIAAIVIGIGTAIIIVTGG